MPTNFPATLDTSSSLATISGSQTLAVAGHSTKHNDVRDAVLALQAKMGADASVVPTSLDYRVRAMETPTMRRWRRGLARVRSGTSNCKLLCIGDSTTQGVYWNGAAFATTTSWPRHLATMLDEVPGLKASHGFGMAQSGNGLTAVPDTRFAAGSGWTIPLPAFGFAESSTYQCAAGAGGALTYTPGIACDTFEIYYARFATGGVLSVSVDGGAASSLNCAGADGILKFTKTTTLGSSHVLSITRTSGGPDFILGIDCYDSTSKTVQVMNAGSGGAETADFVTNNNVWRSLPMLTAVAADLVVVQLGINDAHIAGATPATFDTNITTIANTAIAAGGDVVLASVIPSQDADDAALEEDYRAILSGRAAALGMPFVDVFGRWTDWAAADTDGFMSDSLHGTVSGYADVAAAVAKVVVDV